MSIFPFHRTCRIILTNPEEDEPPSLRQNVRWNEGGECFRISLMEHSFSERSGKTVPFSSISQSKHKKKMAVAEYDTEVEFILNENSRGAFILWGPCEG